MNGVGRQNFQFAGLAAGAAGLINVLAGFHYVEWVSNTHGTHSHTEQIHTQ
jgi:hypothetical protein